MGPTVARSTLIGRAAPLSQLHAALDAAADGRGGLVLVEGEAGIGKTRLVEELAARAPCPVLRAVCDERGGAPAYWPWTQLLRAVHAQPGGEVMLAALGPRRAEVQRLLDLAPDSDVVGEGVAEHADTRAARFRMFDSVTRVLAEAGRVSTHLLLVEDVHWADPSSLLLLEHVATHLRGLRLLLVATVRDDEAPASLTGIRRTASVVHLDGLSAPEVAELAAEVTAQHVSAEHAAALSARTNGNPFFVRELVRLLDAEQRGAGGTLPVSVRAVIERRLARLPQPVHDVLATASVLGADVDMVHLGVVTGTGRTALLSALETAAHSGLVRVTPPQLTFAHALVRETLYAGIPADRRVELHAQVATMLDGQGVSPAVVARHWLLGMIGPDEARLAIDRSVLAATQALALTGYDEAARHYANAIDATRLLERDDLARATLMLGRADALLRAGDVVTARQAYDDIAGAARRLDPDNGAELLAAAALGFSSGLGGFEVRLADQRQIDLLEEALGRLATDHPLRPIVLARLSIALGMVDSAQRRLELAEEAVASARRGGDPVVLAQALAAHCDAIAGPDHSERRAAQASELIDLAARHGLHEQQLLGRRLRFVALLEMGNPAAWADADAFARLVDVVRQPLYAFYVPLWKATNALLSGRVDEAARHCDEAARLGALCQSDNAVMLTDVQRFLIALERGTVADVISVIEQALSPIGELTEILPERAYAYAVVGRPDEAAAILDRAAAVGYWPEEDAEWLPAVVAAALTAVHLGSRAHAERLLALLTPYSHRFAFEGIGAGCWGAVSRYCGQLAALLGRVDEARALLRDAVAANTKAGMPVLAAAAQAELDALTGAGAAVPDSADGTAPASMRREGELWTLRYAGGAAQIRDRKGLRDLAVLLARPGEHVHVLELVANAEGRSGDDSNPPGTREDPLLDRQALAAYRTRLREIDDELDEAAARNDDGRVSTLTDEREFLTAELSAALGLGGRVRTTSGPAERARKAVAARIRDAVRRVGSQHPRLGAHLQHAVRTGTFCVYAPEQPTPWQVG